MSGTHDAEGEIRWLEGFRVCPLFLICRIWAREIRILGVWCGKDGRAPALGLDLGSCFEVEARTVIGTREVGGSQDGGPPAQALARDC